MSFLHKSSTECAKSELDLFHTPETQAMIYSGKWVDYYPISVLEGDSPIEFKVNGSSEEYIDVGNTFFYTEVKVVDSKGNAFANEPSCAPINLFLHSLFSQVDISLNDILVTSSVNTYAYRSYIETLLNYGEDSKLTHLTASMFYKDTAGEFDSIETLNNGQLVASKNDGFIKSKEKMGVSKTIDMYGKLHADIFHQDRYLLNNVDMKLRLCRNRTEFCLMGDDKISYRINIQKAILFVRKVKLNPEVILAHALVLEKTTAKYPIRRVETKVISISSGVKNYIHDNVSTGALPSRVVVGLVESDSYNGNLKKNPYNFQHFNMSRINLSVDGEETPHKAIEMNFTNNNYILGYYTLFTGINKSVTESGNFIDRDDYGNGYTLFAFDLTGDLCSGDHFNLVRNGNLRISFNFSAELAKSVNCIVYMEYQNLIEINKNRQILFDYTI